MTCSRSSPAFRRYNVRVVVAMLIYVVALFGAVWAFQHHAVAGPLRYLVAVAPALPLVAVVVIMGLFLREETDEFLRSQMVEQILWATGGMLALTSVYGFLENFGLARHFEAYWAAVVWFAMLGLARVVVMWRYR